MKRVNNNIFDPSLTSDTHRRKLNELDLPLNIASNDIMAVAKQTLLELKNRPFFDYGYDVKANLVNAAKIWWLAANEITNEQTRNKTHKLCVKLILYTIFLKTDCRNCFTCTLLMDNSRVEITPVNFDILCMASKLIGNMFSNEASKCAFSLNTKKPLFDQVMLKIINPDYQIPDEINKVELLSTVIHLGIQPLEIDLLNSLEQVLLEALPKKFGEILESYVFLHNSTHNFKKNHQDLCLVSLIKIALNRANFTREQEPLNFNHINTLIPGLTFHPVDSPDFIQVDPTLQDNYQEIRNIFLGVKNLFANRYQEVFAFIKNSQAFENNLPLLFLSATTNGNFRDLEHSRCARDQLMACINLINPYPKYFDLYLYRLNVYIALTEDRENKKPSIKIIL